MGYIAQLIHVMGDMPPIDPSSNHSWPLASPALSITQKYHPKTKTMFQVELEKILQDLTTVSHSIRKRSQKYNYGQFQFQVLQDLPSGTGTLSLLSPLHRLGTYKTHDACDTYTTSFATHPKNDALLCCPTCDMRVFGGTAEDLCAVVHHLRGGG